MAQKTIPTHVSEKPGTAGLFNGRIGAVVFSLALLLLFLTQTISRARARFWYDELFTYYVAKQPTLSGMWTALTSGLDQQPPLFYVLGRVGWALTGNAELGLRLPSIAGFLLMTICLFAFARHRYGFAPAFISVLFIWLSPAYAYASDARPYALVLGFTMLALFSWQRAAETERRRVLYLALLSVGIAGALLCHCYAILIFIPLGVGELFRLIERRRLDWPMLVAMAIPTPSVLFYVALLQGSRSLLTHRPWSEPMWIRIVNFYKDIVDPTVIPFTATFFGAGVLVLLLGKRLKFVGGDWLNDQRDLTPMPVYEVAAVMSLAALPIAGLLMGKFLTGVFEMRYVFPFIIGFAIMLAAFAAYARRLPLLQPVLMLMLTLWFVAGSLGASSRAQKDKTAFTEVPAFVADAVEQTSDPIVLVNPFLYLELSHYAPAEVKSRIVYVVDPATAVKYGDTDVFDIGLPVVKKWSGTNPTIVPIEEFRRAHSQFLLYAESDRPIVTWIMRKLLDDGMDVRLKRTQQYDSIWQVRAAQ